MTTPVLSAPLDLITTALLTFWRGSTSQNPTDWTRKVWDGTYGGDPTSPTYPYDVLYRITGGSSDATPDMSGVRRTITVPWQLTTVGKYRNQCERAAQTASDRLLARTRTGFLYPLAMPDGWRCTYRRPDPAMPGIDRSGEHPNAIFSLPARFYLTISPA